MLGKNPKGHQMTKKLLEIERKRQLASNIEELIKRLQDLGFKLQSNLHEIDTYILVLMSILCRRSNVCGFASAMVLPR